MLSRPPCLTPPCRLHTAVPPSLPCRGRRRTHCRAYKPWSSFRVQPPPQVSSFTLVLLSFVPAHSLGHYLVGFRRPPYTDLTSTHIHTHIHLCLVSISVSWLGSTRGFGLSLSPLYLSISLGFVSSFSSHRSTHFFDPSFACMLASHKAERDSRGEKNSALFFVYGFVHVDVWSLAVHTNALQFSLYLSPFLFEMHWSIVSRFKVAIPS